ncbi:DNA cytosine methyltransferase [Propionibacterium freudenreichii]|uniref:DNA cytosine methyltransferase n=1 Tax=Propionibacterium freudenreichii TaxID=1744 RepID=UPI001E4A6EC7|nr:DNA cytosine methyltransferase [Propionibacterium freudenreichii]
MGVQSVTGGRVSWVSDVEPGPCTILDAHHPDIPNLGDVTAIDWKSVEPVDVICGGSPCQDLSMAGRRAGMRPGTRSGLWESMLAAITTIRPRLVVWENVRGALSADAFTLRDLEPGSGHLGDRPAGPSLRALGRVLGDLASIGYDAEWCCLRASDVGAPHRRERVFVVAHPQGQPWRSDIRECGIAGDPDRAARDEWRQPAAGETQGGRARADARGSDRALMSHLLPTPTARDVKDNRIARNPKRPDDTDTLSRALTIIKRDRWFGQYAPAITRWEAVLGREAPAPTEPGRTGQRLSARFVEWMMGLPDGLVTDTGISHSQQLRALGNGAVPQQAAAAIRTMLTNTDAMEAAA